MSTTPTKINLNLADSMSQVQVGPSGFVMDGAREILALTAGAVHIEQQIKALEDAVGKNPGLAFDLTKALIESVCKTILRDRGQIVLDEDDLPKLFGKTLEQLRVLPDTHTADRETGRSIRKTAGALHGVVQGICELRNKQGFASHGKVADTQPLGAIQAELTARSADAVVTFLFKAHRNYALPTAKPKKIEYMHNGDFNAYVDESHEPVTILSLAYQASRVLYDVDYDAYVEALNSFMSEEPDEERAQGSSEVPA